MHACYVCMLYVYISQLCGFELYINITRSAVECCGWRLFFPHRRGYMYIITAYRSGA